MSFVLQTHQLSKKYGSFQAVNNLSIAIKKGEVFGILGPNGSGKTTTLGMILGVLNKTEGDFIWFEDKNNENQRRKIGSILEHPIFYPDLSAYKNLLISSKIKECGEERIEIVLKRVGLFARKDDKYKNYSLGMKQRLALASALLSDPEVLVLDEPTNGLDPQGINQMRELILSIADEGKTIIISSHLLDEVQKICSHVAILKNGKLIKQGSIDELLSQQTKFLIQSKSLNEAFDFSEFSFIDTTTFTKEGILILCKEKISGEEINRKFWEKGIVLSSLIEYKSSLEEEFLNLVK